MADNGDVPSARYTGRYTTARVVLEACYLFRDRRVEALLRRDLHWRIVRLRVLGLDLFGTRWRGRPNGKAMRLTRRGLELKEAGQVRSYTWQDMQEVVQVDRTYDR